MNKICTKCNLSLNYHNFYKNKSAKDGFRNICKNCFNSLKSQYYSKNKEKIKTQKQMYRDHNKEKTSRASTLSNMKRLKTDNLFKLRCNIKSLIYHSLKNKNIKKNTKTTTLLNCSILEFKEYISKQFKPGMTWENYGEYWSIDHICPCAQAQNEEELIKLQNYLNLQPMVIHGSNGNLAKSNKKTIEAEEFCLKFLNRTWIE